MENGMKKSRKVAGVVGLALCLVVGRAWTVRAANEDANPVAAADGKILSEIHDHSELMDNLEYLSDEIGPRLTGSPQLKRANDWTAEMFKKYGLTNVHLEAYSIPHAWERGCANYCSNGASADDCFLGLGPEHEGQSAWAGDLFRRKEAGGVRKVQRQAAGRDPDFAGAEAAFAAEAYRSEPRNLSPAGRAATADRPAGAA